MLTVVMPLYNSEPYVAEAIGSVLAQTHRDLVLIALDDGSRDGTLAAARAAAAGDPRARVMTHAGGANLGACNTMNVLLDLAPTEWVAVMHGDDVMFPTRLARQLAFVEANPDLAVASSLVDWIDEAGRFVGRSRSPLTTRAGVADLVARGGVVAFPHPAVIFRKSVVQAVGGYRQVFWPAEDLDLWNRIAHGGHPVLVQPDVLMNYRLHGGSTSTIQATFLTRKIRWMEQGIAARRAGLTEPTWEEFLAARQSGPWLRRANVARRDRGRTMYQNAISQYAGGQYGRFARSLLGAAALEPEVVVGRLLARVGGLAVGRVAGR